LPEPATIANATSGAGRRDFDTSPSDDRAPESNNSGLTLCNALQHNHRRHHIVVVVVAIPKAAKRKEQSIKQSRKCKAKA
jgi:hypothetical protein